MSKFDIPWFAMCRADTSKKETWKKMSDNGCQGVKLGVESGSQVVVDKIETETNSNFQPTRSFTGTILAN